MKKILILIIFLTAACGYQPMYISKNTENYTFKEITLTGNDKINKKIVSALNLKKDSTGVNKNEAYIDSDINTFVTSKNSKGQITSYRTTITLNFKIKDNNEITKNKKFLKDFSYNNKENKFKLNQYQKGIEKSLTKKIIEEMVIYLDLQ
tara:strand:+ start:92 stop:541 length:450 start_codon:yes stop_codon:yes gene_type:complete